MNDNYTFLDTLKSAVFEATGKTWDEHFSNRSRRNEIIRWRFLIFLAWRNLDNATTVYIGETCGYHHSTICHDLVEAENMMHQYPNFAADYKRLVKSIKSNRTIINNKQSIF